MTVRISDEAAAHIDALVHDGSFGSRAQYLSWLVEREATRARAWADIQKMRAEGTIHDAELESIVKATSSRSLRHLD